MIVHGSAWLISLLLDSFVDDNFNESSKCFRDMLTEQFECNLAGLSTGPGFDSQTHLNTFGSAR